MRDLLVGEPAHETVKVPRQALVALRCEASFTARAMIGHRPELHNLPAYRSRRNDEVGGALAPRLHFLRPLPSIEGHDMFALAEGAAGCRYFHSVCRPQIAVLPVSALRLAASPPLRRFRSNEHMASLVVKIGPLIDELELGIPILRPSHGTRQVVEPRHGRYARHCTGPALRTAVWRLAQESTDSAQRVAVLEIVLDQPSFPRCVAGPLPVLAPDNALNSRSVRLRPAAASPSRRLLEAVRMCGKIKM